jgi:hypothetical protein
MFTTLTLSCGFQVKPKETWSKVKLNNYWPEPVAVWFCSNPWKMPQPINVLDICKKCPKIIITSVHGFSMNHWQFF